MHHAKAAARSLSLIALPDFPLVEPGADLVGLICDSCRGSGTELADNDIVVIAQKVVSKAEGRYVDLATITPSAEATALAEKFTRIRGWLRSFSASRPKCYGIGRVC